MPAAARSAASGRHVFISHSSEDAALAEKVCRALESDGLATWICSRDIQPGQIWPSAIAEGLERSGVFVLLFTAHANKSEHVLREVNLAVKQKVPILPVRLDDAVLSKEIEYYVDVAHWISAADGDVEPLLCRLTEGCRNLLGIQEQEARLPPPDTQPRRQNRQEANPTQRVVRESANANEADARIVPLRCFKWVEPLATRV